MLLSAGTVQKQQQTVTMSPEHIMGKSMLKMCLQELQQFIDAQFSENPALVLEEEPVCPLCGSPLNGNACHSCGSRKIESFDDYSHDDEWLPKSPSHQASDDDYYEVFAGVASPESLIDHLKMQIRASMNDDDTRVAEYIVECLDDDGYLHEPLIDIANLFNLSVPQAEVILYSIQRMDPYAMGSRDLRECLLIQLSCMVSASREKEIAELILYNHWDDFCRMKLDRIAKFLHIDKDYVMRAARFIREKLTPYPSSAFRDPWEKFVPRQVSSIRPDIIINIIDDELTAALVDPVSGRISVDSMYSDLFTEMSQKKNSYKESDKTHIRDSVLRARSVIDALEFRKSTLRKIADELLIIQKEFFVKGTSALMPITKKELAERIGVHESTVCRATQDKSIQLPSGEVIPFDTIFDSALPIKELVRQLSNEQLSDNDIAQRLSESGIQIARRTVAKYRSQLGVLTRDYRSV